MDVEIRVKPVRLTLIVVMLVLMSAVFLPAAWGRKFKVLHTFHGKDGALPISQLVRDAEGNLYGTTSNGGLGKCFGVNCGTVFKMDRTGKLIWSYSFHGKDGFNSWASLLRDAKGNLYGTTIWGGGPDCPGKGNPGCGVVFKLDPAGKNETVLYKFAGNCNDKRDGMNPEGVPVMDAAGNLYGTTFSGGPPLHCFGTAFAVSGTGKETILHVFKGAPDGMNGGLGLVKRGAHSLYGVTSSGGNEGQGTAFRMSTKGKETILYNFTGGSSNGGAPASVLAFDKAGNLYGTTLIGGTNCGGDCGTVFELSPNGGGWTHKTLYVFCQLSSCDDGRQPLRGPLVLDGAGNIYGTTEEGGVQHDCNSGAGCGTVFKLDANGNETVLYSFTGGADGNAPGAGLTMDDKGNLYGTAGEGGDVNCKLDVGYGCGVVFELTP